VLLLNTGSPISPSTYDVKKFLKEFLTDPCIIDLPDLFRSLLVNNIILPFRSSRSAKAYSAIWIQSGSPQIFHTGEIRDKLQNKLNLPVAVGMRYGSPSIEDGLSKLLGLEKIIAVPLFPHNSVASRKSIIDRTLAVASSHGSNMQIKFIPPFYDQHDYINSLVASAEPFLSDEFDKLIFSFHGLPERYLRKYRATKNYCLCEPDCCEKARGEILNLCYRAQALRTAKAFVEKAGIDKNKSVIAFQSRFGMEKWLQPYFDKLLLELPRQGVKRILVISPSFVTDCLETLEEINIRGRKNFLEAGGEKFTFIPCLNDFETWVDSLAKMITTEINS